MSVIVKGTKRKNIKIELVGKNYTIRTPKTAAALIIARAMSSAGKDPQKILKAMEDWLKIVFGTETSKDILKRLEDPEDDLDFQDILETQTKIVSEMTGNPTTSSGD